MHVITEAERASFEKDGYLVVPNVFKKEDLDAADRTLRRLVRYELERARETNPTMPEVPVGREFEEGMTLLDQIDHKYISFIHDTQYKLPEGYRLISEPEVRPILNQLMGHESESALICSGGYIVIGMPQDKTYTVGWHKDTFTIPPHGNLVQIWAPLVKDSTVEGGTLKLMPGSHKAGWRGQKMVEGVRGIFRYQITDEELAKYEPKDVEVALGDMLVFQPGMIHSGGNNISKSCRFSFAAFYFQVEDKDFDPSPKVVGEEYFRKLTASEPVSSPYFSKLPRKHLASATFFALILNFVDSFLSLFSPTDWPL